jgi:hypothetical protein
MVGRADHLDHVRDGILREQHPAEHTLLRRYVVRRSPLEVVTPRNNLGDAHPPLLPVPVSAGAVLAGAVLAILTVLAMNGARTHFYRRLTPF